ncbi:MAG: hypothetical protein IPJ76_02440 [Flavobacteriales bacterium]|nr:MAG: hypothetical protein IPJ76_02440 [Flavobacteriales bacterium]
MNRADLLQAALPAARYLMEHPEGPSVFDIKRMPGFTVSVPARPGSAGKRSPPRKQLPNPLVPPVPPVPLAAATVPAEQDALKIITAAVNAARNALHQRVCVQWDYCAKMKKYGKGTMLVLNALPVVQAFFASFNAPLAIAAFLVHLVKDQLLDVLCGCAAT